MKFKPQTVIFTEFYVVIKVSSFVGNPVRERLLCTVVEQVYCGML